MSEQLVCPFCADDDFDTIGLKGHLLSGHCETFEKTSVAYNPFAKSFDARSDLARKILDVIRPIADRDRAGEECLYAMVELFTREQIDLGE